MLYTLCLDWICEAYSQSRSSDKRAMNGYFLLYFFHKTSHVKQSMVDRSLIL